MSCRELSCAESCPVQRAVVLGAVPCRELAGAESWVQGAVPCRELRRAESCVQGAARAGGYAVPVAVLCREWDVLGSDADAEAARGPPRTSVRPAPVAVAALHPDTAS